MSKADLAADLKALLMDAASHFSAAGNTEMERFLDQAALDLARHRRYTLLGSITLVADQRNYNAPADLVVPKFGLWGRDEQRRRQPWAVNHPGRLPTLRRVNDELHLDPPPTAAQIADLGATYQFYYFANPVIDRIAANTTVKPEDRDLLLLRATVHALQALANRNISKPVSLGTGGGGLGSMPKNGTPQGLAAELLQQFERMAAHG